MPTISMFYGIIISMFFFDNKQHQSPHFHAKYGEYTAVFGLPQGKLIEGKMPRKQMKLIAAWVELHRDELVADWELAIKGGSVYPIDPLR